jgi:hypothetical protein
MYLYSPPNPKATGKAAVLRSGHVIHTVFPIFEAYYSSAAIPYKTLVGNCLRLLLSEPMVRVENMPSFGQVAITAQKGRLMAHLLAYVPERRGAQKDIVEEPITVEDTQLWLRLDGRRVERVYEAPSERPLHYEVAGGYIGVRVPKMAGYCLVVVEERSR